MRLRLFIFNSIIFINQPREVERLNERRGVGLLFIMRFTPSRYMEWERDLPLVSFLFSELDRPPPP